VQIATCQCVSVFGNALTRGKQYSVLAVDEEKRQVRVRGDNGRIRWFPAYCFTLDATKVPILVDYWLDPVDTPHDFPIDVTVQLSDGQERWCVFATPTALVRCGDCIEGTDLVFRYHNRHLIVASRLSHDLIGRMLRHIDSQGRLAECTLPCGDADEGAEVPVDEDPTTTISDSETEM